jgi:hypothetical protein
MALSAGSSRTFTVQGVKIKNLQGRIEPGLLPSCGLGLTIWDLSLPAKKG